jgi:hypothetical protein
MKVMFFEEASPLSTDHDGRIINFAQTEELPAPSDALLADHFNQCVLANIKHEGLAYRFDYDPDDDDRTLTDSEEGKRLFETVLAERLGHLGFEHDGHYRGSIQEASG